MTVTQQIALLAALITGTGIIANAGILLAVNKRTLRKTDELLDRRNTFEEDMARKKREYEESLPQQNALQAFKDDLLAIQRHSEMNWLVAANMLEGMTAPGGTPYIVHYKKFAYRDYISLEASNLRYLPAHLRKGADKIRVMIDNANIEVREAVEIANTRDLIETRKVTVRLMEQFAVYFTLWTAMDKADDFWNLVAWTSEGRIEQFRLLDLQKSGRSAAGLHLNPDPSRPLSHKPVIFYESTA